MVLLFTKLNGNFHNFLGTFDFKNLCTCVQEYHGERIDWYLDRIGLNSIFRFRLFQF